jgi:hypothetical protein
MLKILLASIKPYKDEWRGECIIGDPDSTLRKTSGMADFLKDMNIGPVAELDTPLKVGSVGVTGQLRSVLEWVALMHEQLEKETGDGNTSTKTESSKVGDVAGR